MADKWWRSALCAQVGGDYFFMDQGDHGGRAKTLCARCEVRVQCLAEELQYDEQGGGIFGGFGVLARRQLHLAVARGADPWEVALTAIERQGARAS